MDNMELGEVQLRFAELVWHYAPLPSGELVKICQRELNWKKPTTYTVLRKLCEKGLFKNENGDRKSTRLNSSHNNQSRMPSSA